jgi:hypothetical protein
VVKKSGGGRSFVVTMWLGSLCLDGHKIKSHSNKNFFFLLLPAVVNVNRMLIFLKHYICYLT